MAPSMLLVWSNAAFVLPIAHLVCTRRRYWLFAAAVFVALAAASPTYHLCDAAVQATCLTSWATHYYLDFVLSAQAVVVVACHAIEADAMAAGARPTPADWRRVRRRRVLTEDVYTSIQAAAVLLNGLCVVRTADTYDPLSIETVLAGALLLAAVFRSVWQPQTFTRTLFRRYWWHLALVAVLSGISLLLYDRLAVLPSVDLDTADGYVWVHATFHVLMAATADVALSFFEANEGDGETGWRRLIWCSRTRRHRRTPTPAPRKPGDDPDESAETAQLLVRTSPVP